MDTSSIFILKNCFLDVYVTRHSLIFYIVKYKYLHWNRVYTLFNSEKYLFYGIQNFLLSLNICETGLQFLYSLNITHKIIVDSLNFLLILSRINKSLTILTSNLRSEWFWVIINTFIKFCFRTIVGIIRTRKNRRKCLLSPIIFWILTLEFCCNFSILFNYFSRFLNFFSLFNDLMFKLEDCLFLIW